MSYSIPPGPNRRVFSRGQRAWLVSVVSLLILTGGLLAYTAISARNDARQGSLVATPRGTARSAASTPIPTHTSLLATSSPTTTATPTVRATGHPKASATLPAGVSGTAQPIGAPDPYSSYDGRLILSDPLASNTQGHGWDVYALPGDTSCQFAGGAYESSTEWIGNGRNSIVANDCIAQNTDYSDFTLQAQVTIVKGSCAGIAFRATSRTSSQYDFVICLQDGFWGLRYAENGLIEPNILQGSSTAIHAALGQANVLAVVASGQTITLYANGQRLGSATCSIFSAGQIGLDASGDEGNMNVALFRNVEVWVH